QRFNYCQQDDCAENLCHRPMMSASSRRFDQVPRVSYRRDARKRGVAIWERVVQGADMKYQCWFSRCCVVGLICCVGGLIVGTWGKTGIPVAGVTPPKSPPVNEYVDSRLCARCHSQIYETYRQTGMARSLFKPSPANTIEDYKGNKQFY